MDRVHDLGGRQVDGDVEVLVDEPVFSEPWERAARALVYAAMGAVANPTTSGFRHSIERMEPAHYLDSSYYEHWLTSAATLAVEAGVVTPEELADRAGGPFPLARPAAEVPADRLGTGAQRFAVGDRVRVRPVEHEGHTRAPAYVQGRTGVVTEVCGRFSLPDVEAHARRRVKEAQYTVRFAASGLWPDGDPSADVLVGLWDSYLEGT